MPWGESSVTEQRLRFVVAASRREHTMAELCREFQISRQTGYLWLSRYQQGGAGQMRERSRKPQHSPRRTAGELEQEVIELRRQHPDWGAAKLRVLLQQQRAQVNIHERTVHRILLRHDLVAAEHRHRPALERFERASPNELWQMDFKGPQGFNRGSPVGPLSILDDHSRYILQLKHLGSTRAAGVRDSLQTVFEQVGLPEALLVDHGTPWWCSAGAWGLTELAVWILQQGVRLTYSGFRHPQTQGKVERMHGALQRAVRARGGDPCDQQWLNEFRQEYNYVRPHEGIGMKTPAERWQPSSRRFVAKPPEWEYESSLEVRNLSRYGQLYWRGRDWEISRVLREQRVGIEIVGDRALVYFCRTPVRELDLQTGRALQIPLDGLRSLQC
jgi:transposase InsO family protein